MPNGAPSPTLSTLSSAIRTILKNYLTLCVSLCYPFSCTSQPILAVSPLLHSTLAPNFEGYDMSASHLQRQKQARKSSRINSYPPVL